MRFGRDTEGQRSAMGLITYLLLLALTGLIVGALARLALPGRDPMSIGATILIGIAGSILAGLVAWAIFGGRNGGGIVLSVLFSTVIVYFIRRSRGGGLTSPGGPARDPLTRR
jgi:uncharacterized membrane protein YeaQ/YmgE (transglycosylase-associated protein family)